MAKIKALMIGGRRCGKTTILANICKNANDVLHHASDEGNDLFRLNKDEKSINKLNKAIKLIDEMFADLSKYDEFPIDDNQTATESTIELNLQPLDRGAALTLSFTDIPGEFCVTEPKKVTEYIRESQIIILAIDTPSMYEAEGCYFDICNKYSNIKKQFYDAFNSEYMSESLTDKLVLLVPLKCEKYAISNKTGEIDENGLMKVNSLVKQYYGELINFFQNSINEEKITFAILPIITISEVRWTDYYFLNENGSKQTVYDDSTGKPYSKEYMEKYNLMSVFSFNSQLYDIAKKNGSTSYFCEQPLVYILAYAMKIVKEGKKPQNKSKAPLFGPIINTLRKWRDDILNLFSGNASYEKEINRLSQKYMKRKNGFEIIQNPLSI